ncbi:MAG TPA: response regulator transcription factor [Vicinamibacterales bacterium]
MRTEPSDLTADRSKPSLLVIGGDESASVRKFDFLEHGFEVAVADGGITGLGRAFQGDFDIIVLDTSGPRLNGLEVLRQLRQRSDTPAIVLAEGRQAADRIDALEAGADDCLEGQFEPGELAARLRAVLRRVNDESAARPRRLRMADLTLNPLTRVVECRGMQVTLSAIECDLLATLMRAAGRVVSRDEFGTALYQRKLEADERSVDIRISHLRRKLARVSSRNVIRTVRGVGYFFIIGELRTG